MNSINPNDFNELMAQKRAQDLAKAALQGGRKRRKAQIKRVQKQAKPIYRRPSP